MTETNNITYQFVSADVLQQIVRQHLQDDPSRTCYHNSEGKFTWSHKAPGAFFTYFLYDDQERVVETGEIYCKQTGSIRVSFVGELMKPDISNFVRSHPTRCNVQCTVYADPQNETKEQPQLQIDKSENATTIQTSIAENDNSIQFTDGYTEWLLLCTGFSEYKIRHQLTAPQWVHSTQQPQPCMLSAYYNYFVASTSSVHYEVKANAGPGHYVSLNIPGYSGISTGQGNVNIADQHVANNSGNYKHILASAILPWHLTPDTVGASPALATPSAFAAMGNALARGSPPCF